MTRVGVVVFALLFATICAEGQQSPAKHRVAVLSFTHMRVLTSVEDIFGSNEDVGKVFSDMLADRLTTDGAFRIIDRSATNRALTAPVAINNRNTRNLGGLLDLGNHDEGPEPSISKIGALLGVNELIQVFEADSIIIGEITTFGRDKDKKTGILAALKSRVWGDSSKRKAVVGVTARMIDLNAGDILAAVSVKAESQHSSSNLLVARGFRENVASMESSDFPKTTLGEAVLQAVNSLALAFEHNASMTPVVNPIQISGIVADVADTDVTINVGAVNGVHVGDTLLITRTTRKIKDPKTGDTLRPVEVNIGQIVVTSVNSFFAIGRFSGEGKVAVNDVVKNMPQ
jgi:curli biogenesis system outer membrane secretion channel CsgG